MLYDILAELLRIIGDVAGYIIMALLIFIPIYSIYRKRKGGRKIEQERFTPKPIQPEQFTLPAGEKEYDLIANPNKLDMLLQMLKDENITPKTQIDKHGIHLKFRTYRTVNCPVLVEAGLITNFNVTPLEKISLWTEEKEEPFTETTTLPSVMLPTNQPKRTTTRRKKKPKGKVTVILSFQEEFPEDWTEDQIKSAITYKFKDVIGKPFEVEIQ